MGFKLRLFKSSTFSSSSASSSNSDLHNQLSETTTATTTITRVSSSSSFSRHHLDNNTSPSPPPSPKKKKFFGSLSRLLGGTGGDQDWLSKQPLKYPGKPDPTCLATLNAFQWGSEPPFNSANGNAAHRMQSYCSTSISPGTSRRGSLV